MLMLSSDAEAAIGDFFKTHGQARCVRELAAWRRQPAERSRQIAGIALYEAVIAWLEPLLWEKACDEHLLAVYQQCFRELEALIGARGTDLRHEFVIVIPVADRPRHLRQCLDSLWELCETYHYGGIAQSRYRKITVLIADDSRGQDNIEQHKALADDFNRKGLAAMYFGQAEQLILLAQCGSDQPLDFIGVGQRSTFHHKGASAMRNIAYLKLRELTQKRNKPLFYFIDSDQEFKVRIAGAQGVKDCCGLNYFYYLDKIFSHTDARVLTGKVVGDPPVSPAVMAGNFVSDVIAFLRQMARVAPAAQCQFHQTEATGAVDAAYHDMADLFGFKPAPEVWRYQCTRSGAHDHIDCFAHFASKLTAFFDGEHPTRQTLFEYQNAISSLAPARTVYTGNYVLAADALEFFIPFAALKLRMAGPVLGRLIKAAIGNRFMSANLPMLHTRTVAAIGCSEFRPGVRRAHREIDLADEFERQFFGDVMLFSMEKLLAEGYPCTAIARQRIVDVVASVEVALEKKYREKHRRTMSNLARLKTLRDDRTQWWNASAELRAAGDEFDYFIANIEENFGAHARAYQLLATAENQSQRRRQLVDGIARYAADQMAWRHLLNAAGRPLEQERGSG
jgi:hypothetical protein